jgi:hypothetical protein
LVEVEEVVHIGLVVEVEEVALLKALLVLRQVQVFP